MKKLTLKRTSEEQLSQGFIAAAEWADATLINDSRVQARILATVFRDRMGIERSTYYAKEGKGCHYRYEQLVGITYSLLDHIGKNISPHHSWMSKTSFIIGPDLLFAWIEHPKLVEKVYRSYSRSFCKKKCRKLLTKALPFNPPTDWQEVAAEMRRSNIRIIQRWKERLGWDDEEFGTRLGVNRNTCARWIKGDEDIALDKFLSLFLCIGQHLYGLKDTALYREFKEETLREGVCRIKSHLWEHHSPAAEGHPPTSACPSAFRRKGTRPHAQGHAPNIMEEEDKTVRIRLIKEALDKVRRLTEKKHEADKQAQMDHDYIVFDAIDCLTGDPEPDNPQG
ncbi:MAG: hypothetical protein LBN24_03505 [Mediterranea sp.]|jgi:hypothetical protein|nr:hypothetical protein [Mediterranea sp.]